MSNKSNLLRLFKDPKFLIGLIISIVGIYLAFYDFDFSAFVESISDANYFYFLCAIGVMLTSIWVRAIRWTFLLHQEKLIPVSSLYKIEMIGYFGNSVLPLRLGELLRAYFVRKEHNISGTFVIGSIVLERLLDTVGLMLLGILLILVYPLPEEIRNYIQIGLVGLVIVGVILFFIVIKMKNLKSDHKIILLFKKFFASFSVLSSRYKWETAFITILLWLQYWACVHLIQMSLHLNMQLSHSLLILVLSSLAYAIPSAPGTIGTFHAAVKYTLITLIGGYSPETGINFAIVLHAYSYILFIIFGSYYFAKSQFHTGAISKLIEKKNNED